MGGESMSGERWDVVNPTTKTWLKMEVAYIFCKWNLLSKEGG